MRDRAYCGGRFVCAPLHGQVCSPRGSIPWVSGVWCVGTAGEYRRRRKQRLSSPPAQRHSVWPATCAGRWDKNDPRPKQPQRMTGGYIETRQGGREGEGGAVGWKPRCSSIRGGFLPGDNLLQSCSFHESTPHYPPVIFSCFVPHFFPLHICGALITERQRL